MKGIKDDSDEIHANFYVVKLVLDKAKNFTSSIIGSYNITKLMKLLIEIVSYEKSLESDLYKLSDIERRVKDLQMQFSELIKMIS